MPCHNHHLKWYDQTKNIFPMKENKWRSLSIMDLHLSKSRGSFTSGISTATATSTSTSASSRPQSQQEVPLSSNGQSYELIKSTQVRNFHYYMTYYIELLCNNFHYQSVKTITDWLYPCSNEITDWEILNKHSWNNISGNLFFKSRSYGLSFYSHLTI